MVRYLTMIGSLFVLRYRSTNAERRVGLFTKPSFFFLDGLFQFLADTEIAPNDENQADYKSDVVGPGHAVGHGQNADHADD